MRDPMKVVPSIEMLELSIIDYLIWAVQRKLLKGGYSGAC